MMSDTASTPLDESSPSVQAHLSILQGVIQRMANNSSSCKTWCITVVSAVLVIIADKGNPNFAYIAIIPTLLFLVLDAYYLALEKGFRAAYAEFVQKLHNGLAQPSDLFEVAPKGCQINLQLASFKSFSVWGFYITLIVLIELAHRIVLTTGKPA